MTASIIEIPPFFLRNEKEYIYFYYLNNSNNSDK